MAKGLTTLEKALIFLFVIMTGACIGLVVVYFNEKADSSTNGLESGCGGPQVLSGDSGTFTSWNFPSSYDNGRSCAWFITVEPGKVIHLWFEEFALEDTRLCTADMVTLRDTLGTIGKYCGTGKPHPVVSLGNQLHVYFDTNEIRTDQGFKAHFRAVAPESTSEIAGAGGYLQGDRGDLLTPGFPEQNYLNVVLYQWRITVPDGERIRLTFTSFDVVPELCGDFVDVYDGHQTGSSKLGKLCGGKLPAPLESSGNTMVVRFKTDAKLTSKGFSATYTKSSSPPIVIPTTTPGPSTSRPVTTLRPTVTTGPAESGCGGPGILFGRKGVIQSLGYPKPYPAHLHCSWKISVPDGLLVKLHITDMVITGDMGQCKEDKLTVADDLRRFGSYCGNIHPPVMVSAGEAMSITFQSDSRLTDRGFSATWEAVYPEDITEIQGCGMSSREEIGVIKSQNWPSNYKANTECMWNVMVPARKRIALNFTHFDIEPRDMLTMKCLDNVMIYSMAYNKDTHHSVLLRKYGPYCGSKLPAAIQTKGNRLVILFHSDLFMEAKGFRAYWTTDVSQPVPTEPPVLPNPWDGIPIEWPSTCGKPAISPVVNARIVNGEGAKPHSWPWQVSMQVWPDSRPDPTFFHTCGGTLIHKNWVLTAAHCFIRYADELQRWRMCLGKHNLTYTEASERCFGVSGIYRHEGFKYPTVPTVEFDIALIRLDGEVNVSQEISYACLPAAEEVLAGGKKCYATGWGDETGDSLNAKVSEGLNQVALPVVPYDTCKRADYWWFNVKTSMICCGYTQPDELKSVCQGDSGGPLVCRDAADSPWEVHGITSFGPIGCIMNKKPSVFTRSSAYIPWIKNVIRRDMYNEHTSGCGGAKDLTGTDGTLSSMGYPGSYSNKARCQWSIRAPAGKVVHLQFRNISLEESQLCMNDKVIVTDRLGRLGTFCSHTPPQDLLSDGEMLQITFSSNDRVVDTGFLAAWKAVDPSEGRCGGVFSSSLGEITSPNWPDAYPAQAVCTWRITIPSAVNITVAFTHFEVQPAVLSRCLDYVEIFDGEGTALDKFCGHTLPPAVTIPGNTTALRFLSNRVNQHGGFRSYWTTNPLIVPTLPPTTPTPWDNTTLFTSGATS